MTEKPRTNGSRSGPCAIVALSDRGGEPLGTAGPFANWEAAEVFARHGVAPGTWYRVVPEADMPTTGRHIVTTDDERRAEWPS